VLRLSGTTWGTLGSGYARPEAVAPSGSKLYVADTGNSRVLELDAASGAVRRTLAGPGSGPGQVREPEGVAADASGNVLVSDTGNHRVARFDAGGAYIDSFGGNGTGAGQLIEPAQLASGAYLFVADPFNNRVQRYRLSSFSLAADPASATIPRGSTATATVRVTPTGGFDRPVALSLSGCPAGATCSLSTTTLTPSGGAYPTATLRIVTSATTTRGSYSVRIAGNTTSPTIPKTAHVAATVS
jgi:DNA-binding beta-propeller fold protein YncE